jgi:hypothetical protein
VIRRFQIEDLIVQDGSGVVFRALDTETGKMVAVRRFFPFGAHRGGLKEDEQTAYNIALGRMGRLNHPALRSVVCGGCDPVDGVPFMATEWIEGNTLEPIMQQGPLPADVAVLLLTQLLEVSEMLSQVLADEAVWVETELSTIVLGDEQSGRGFTFWISPLKWLGGNENPRGLESIIALTEKIMGWKGKAVNDEAGHGLGAWLKWLRKAAPTATLREARENLAAAIGAEPPPAAKNLVSAAKRPPAPKSSKVFVLAGLGLVLILTGFGGWRLTRNRTMPELRDLTSLPDDAALASQRAAVKKRGGAFTTAESELLALEKGRSVTLEGRLVKTGTSSSGKTIYLYFSESPPANEVRGSLAEKDADGFNATPLIGKKLRITGKVKVVKDRPEIEIAKRAAIEVAE